MITQVWLDLRPLCGHRQRLCLGCGRQLWSLPGLLLVREYFQRGKPTELRTRWRSQFRNGHGLRSNRDSSSPHLWHTADNGTWDNLARPRLRACQFLCISNMGSLSHTRRFDRRWYFLHLRPQCGNSSTMVLEAPDPRPRPLLMRCWYRWCHLFASHDRHDQKVRFNGSTMC